MAAKRERSPRAPCEGTGEGMGEEGTLAARLAALEQGEGPAWEFPQLAGMLAHASKHIRRLAAGALSTSLRRGDVDAAACRALLGSDDEHTRWGAAFALSRAGLGDDASTRAAVAHLDCPDGDVRWAAAAIVVAEARGCATLRDTLRGLSTTGTARARKMALLCLCDSGQRDASLYVGALADPDPYVRMAGLTSLARGGHRDEPSLAAIAGVAERDESDAVRRAASAVHRRLTAHGTR